MAFCTAFRASLLCLVPAFVLHSPTFAEADRPAALSTIPKSGTYPQTVYGGAIANPVSPKLTTFSQLMKLAFPGRSLKSFFDGSSHTTIFAPTNAAFEELVESMTDLQRESLLDPNTGSAENILRVHFTEGDWYLQPPPIGIKSPADSVGALRMADDGVVNVFGENASLRIQCAGIVERLTFANGVVHLVDKVVMPSGAPKKLKCDPPTTTN